MLLKCCADDLAEGGSHQGTRQEESALAGRCDWGQEGARERRGSMKSTATIQPLVQFLTPQKSTCTQQLLIKMT